MNERSHVKTYLSCTDLRGRGWTDITIRKLLGEPDATKPNPYYRSGAPMRLYSRQRVEEVETTEEWSNEHSRTERRQASAAKATATKKAKLMSQLNALKISVPQLSMDLLTKRACTHYNDRKQVRFLYSSDPSDWDYATATPESGPEFLARITVNYLRHCLTSYEEELANIAGKVGVSEGYAEISQKVYAAIEESYPELAGECQRQLVAKNLVQTQLSQ